jgi:hypothetical protein
MNEHINWVKSPETISLASHILISSGPGHFYYYLNSQYSKEITTTVSQMTTELQKCSLFFFLQCSLVAL